MGMSELQYPKYIEANAKENPEETGFFGAPNLPSGYHLVLLLDL